MESQLTPINRNPSAIFNISSVTNIKDVTIATNTSLTSNLDGDPVIAKYRNLTINQGCTLTVSQRCKGLYLSVFGDLTVNGTISMTARGAKCAGKYILIDKNGVVYFYDKEYDKTLYDNNWEHISAVGGIGVGTAKIMGRSKGANGINGACAAGGNMYRKGGNGSSFSGGAGCGGDAYAYWSSDNWYYGTAGTNNGGAGGNAAGAKPSSGLTPVGSGAGNPAGTNYGSGTVGASGTGGLLIIFVKGKITIGDKGSIQANGSKGGNGKTTTKTQDGGGSGGAGSGGGAVHIFYGDTIINSSKITATGGSGGTGYLNATAWPGGAGGNGTINIQNYKSVIEI